MWPYNGPKLVKDIIVTLHPDRNLRQMEEAVFQAWLERNRAQDVLRYERRLRILVLAAVFLTFGALVWRFIG
jgi:hypothetical protein